LDKPKRDRKKLPKILILKQLEKSQFVELTVSKTIFLRQQVKEGFLSSESVQKRKRAFACNLSAYGIQ